MKLYWFFLFIVVVSCQPKPERKMPVVDTVDKAVVVPILPQHKDTLQLVEHFADSVHVGRPTHNKMEMWHFHSDDTSYVVIYFYRQQHNRWELQNEYSFEKDGITGCEPRFIDYTGDGLNDMTYHSNIAARSANQVRRLFVYNRVGDSLVYIKNSEDYPNMRYNKELKCVDAFAFYGGCATLFARVDHDSLVDIAKVESYEGLTVTEYDSKGREHILFRDTNYHDEFVRYKSYNPLKENDDVEGD